MNTTEPPVCRCGHPADAHDAGQCWTTPDAHTRGPNPCPCEWYEPEPAP